MFGTGIFKVIAPVGMVVSFALVASTAGIYLASMTAAKEGFSIAQTQGMNKRQDRRQDRQGDRQDRRGDRQDCRQEEGAVGKDKRDCKQEERQERNNDNSSTSNDD